MIYVLLPAFNEQDAIGDVCKKLEAVFKKAKLKYLIVVVNDGSTDRTLEVVSSLKNKININVINHNENRGLGNAIKTGFDYVRKKGKGGDIIVTMDADNTHPPDVIPQMIKLIKRKDVVIASRFVKGAEVYGVPIYRRILSTISSILPKLLFRIGNVRDFTISLRAYKFGILIKAYKDYGGEFINQKGFTCMLDILLKLAKLNAKFAEVPVTLRYDKKVGASKMRVMQNVLDTVLLLAKRRAGIYR